MQQGYSRSRIRGTRSSRNANSPTCVVLHGADCDGNEPVCKLSAISLQPKLLKAEGSLRRGSIPRQSAVRGSPREVSNARSPEEPTGTIAELFAPRHSQALPPVAINCTAAGYLLELSVGEL